MPEDKLISNFTVRSILSTLQQVSPAEVPALLKAAKLERLVGAHLTDEASSTVRASDLGRLYAAVYTLSGEPLTRIFLMNYGHKMAPLLLAHPEMVRLTAEGKAIAEGERAGWAARELAGFLTRVWATVTFREAPDAYHLEVEHCPICVAITGTRKPLCASSEVIYTALARALIGKRVSLVEDTCHAQGAAKCSYKLLK